jgi:hypothetical protein
LKNTENQKFNLEIGNLTNLKGNAVIYWAVKNQSANKDEDLKGNSPQLKILAINFVISVFPMDENLITATFPPIGFEEREEFMLYIKQSNSDLINAGELALKKELDYMKSLPDAEYYQLNKIINEYLEIYREKIDHIGLNISLKEKIFLLKRLIKQLRVEMNHKKSFIKVPINNGRMRKLIMDLKNYFNPFDIEKFNEIIYIKGKTADKILELYLEKFISIHYEDYEKASQLTAEIEKSEKKLYTR